MARREGIVSSGARLGVALVILLIAFIGIGQLGLLPSLPNPFATETREVNRPVLLESLEDLAAFTAARANFEVTVDTEEDARFIPSFIKGERTVMVATGDVEAVVDFSELSDGNIEVTDDGSVIVTLPQPELTEARLDNEDTEIVSRSRGLVDRLGGFFAGDPVDDQDLYVAAERKLEIAATDSDLQQRARQNTRETVTALLAEVGFDDVRVTFEQPPAAAV